MGRSSYRVRLCELAADRVMGGGMDGVQEDVGHRAPVVEFQEWMMNLRRESTAEVIKYCSAAVGVEEEVVFVCVCAQQQKYTRVQGVDPKVTTMETITSHYHPN